MENEQTGASIELMERLIHTFAARIRAVIPEVRNAKLVTIIENNINFPLASEIARVLDHPQCGPTTHMRHADRAQPGGVAFGVNTNPGTQYMGVYSARTRICMTSMAN